MPTIPPLIMKQLLAYLIYSSRSPEEVHGQPQPEVLQDPEKLQQIASVFGRPDLEQVIRKESHKMANDPKIGDQLKKLLANPLLSKILKEHAIKLNTPPQSSAPSIAVPAG